jgi:ATP-dependent helicase/nuclease subunit A
MPDRVSPISPIPFPSVTVVSASAGSGKTHALTLHYLRLLLAPGVPHQDLQSILAITFTNNAAREMRQRILQVLKEISLGHPTNAVRDLESSTGLSPIDLQNRARDVIDQILRRYGSFQVRTIDSFVSRVFRASSHEFGFTPDVEIVMESGRFIAQAFDILAREITESSQVAALLIELADVLGEVRRSERAYLWNPFDEMAQGVQQLYVRLAHLPQVLRAPGDPSELRQVEGELRGHANRLLGEFDRLDAPVSQLFKKDLQVLLEKGWWSLLSRTRKAEKFLVQKRTREQQEMLAAQGERLQNLVDLFYESLSRAVMIESRSYYRPMADILELVREPLENVRRSRGALSLDDVNRRLVGHLEAGNVPEVYFALGERIFHYCIDEFQDTSPIQWAALLPLIVNTVSEDGSLFLVGDTKQSIYGFRGADWHIMRHLESGEFSIPSAPSRRAQLPANRRSGEQIVRFVEGVFARIGADSRYGPAVSGSGLDQVHQETVDDLRGKGYVEVVHLDAERSGEGDDTEQPREAYSEREALLNVVRSALERGYVPGDIAILAPGNATVVEVSGWLNSAGIEFLSHSSLDIRNRKVVGEILACLTFLDSPIDDLAFSTFVLGDLFGEILKASPGAPQRWDLHTLLVERAGERRTPAYKAFARTWPTLWEQYFGDLLGRVGHLPLYDLLGALFKTFDPFSRIPQEEGSLARLLEVVHDVEHGGSNSLKEFLRFAADETAEGSPWDLDPPLGQSVVRVMTIHKSKGLQFPVGIVLLSSKRITLEAPLVHIHDDEAELLHITSEMADHQPELALIRDGQLLTRTTDALNRLYVALTRAKEELYVLYTRKKVEDYLSRAFPEPVGSAECRQRIPLQRLQGVLPVTRCYHHTLPRSHVTARISGTRTVSSVRGEYLHMVLSHIVSFTGDAEGAVARAREQTELQIPELVSAHEALIPFLRQKEVALLFAPREGRGVLCEQEMVDRRGNLYRVDRMIVDPDGITVVDFKTGSDHEEVAYREQVQEYLAMVRMMYPNRMVRGALAYIDLCKLVEVR